MVGTTRRRVLITGATRGLGLALSKRIANAEIFILGKNGANLEKAKLQIEQANPSAFVRVVSAVDVRDFSSLEQKLQGIGPLDMLICAHKILATGGNFADLTPDGYRLMVETNVLGVLHIVKATLPYIRKQKKSVIALVSSQAAQAAPQGDAVFSSTQCALQGIGEVLQQELLVQGIQISVVYPPLLHQDHQENVEAVAANILGKLHKGGFNISFGLYGLMLRILHAGMSPQPSVYDGLLEFLLMGPMRIAGMGLALREYRRISESHSRRFSTSGATKPIPLKGSRVLITGGSSGIGLALAKCFAAEDASVFIMARDNHRLERAKREVQAFCGRSVQIISADVTDYKSLRQAVERIGAVDILVCSHGLAQPAKLEKAEVESLKCMMDTNLIGTMNVVHAALPGLRLTRTHRPGCVAILSSQAGQVGVYGYAGYSATKFALRAFAQGLHKEEFVNNIQVCLIYPPDTQTPGFARENIDKPEITKALSSSSCTMDPMKVALKAMNGIQRGQMNVACNLEGMLLGIATAGMWIQPCVWLAIAEIMFMPLLRLSLLFQLYFWYKTITRLSSS